ncbi:MAG: biosynthetic-type acetolactate synthase large subunit [Desulfobacterales bacterium]|jgi:acetolactate synthase-1/2/3 large subunit|nr:biosynthetic-type acetolactate synthase large subunit [Desulfobacterales bacterium]MDD3081526.1 biosynthetic-type acetolactate synthase large subunit [Desulfobacterales bacterium]MDD3949759.1 biosynthetic-type acetolactate synthase large subunit [Desulfobacterales bacterium]MDD4463745.1 biosynthetic-type acetolactate synthase large subunit [Desulfobacterales bacterium]MDY0376985.1 biosynthetic-type acetolactate synthase large subunit [Desulfobacterales bacterium]
MTTKKMTGAQMIIQSLIDEGVEYIFGFPGGAVIPIYDVLYDAPIKHILTRHEQGAAHAADGYARVTGRVGVCLATSGPGATNLVTGLATAHMDSVPMVAITGQVAVSSIGNDSFQESDIYGISIPITKYNYLVKNPDDLQATIREAFHIARTGRPGPVLIDIPKDVQTAWIAPKPLKPVELPGYCTRRKVTSEQIDAILDALRHARRPVIYAGGGVVCSGASPQLREFIKKTRIPITTSLMGKGIYPENDALSLGMLGMHGTKYANHAVHESDLIISMGVRFDDRVAGNVQRFAPLAKIVHIDIDPAEIGKRLAVDIPVVGDLKSILTKLNRKVNIPARQDWLDQVAEIKMKYPLTFKEDGKLMPQFILRTLSEMTRGKAIITTDVGQHQMWAALYYQCIEPRRFVTSGGSGTMGYGFPAAIGATVGCPKLPVVAICGDGSFQMCIQELATVRMYRLPVKIFIFNNGYLGMVRQWQQMFYNRRYSYTTLEFNPDFCQVAKGYDIPAIRVTSSEEVVGAINQALKIDGPVLVDFHIEREENVMPMIPPGGGQTDFILEGEA